MRESSRPEHGADRNLELADVALFSGVADKYGNRGNKIQRNGIAIRYAGLPPNSVGRMTLVMWALLLVDTDVMESRKNRQVPGVQARS